MKTLYTAISILIFISLFSIFSFNYIYNSKEEITNILNSIENNIKKNEDIKNIKLNIQQLEEEWQKKENILSILTKHEILDNIRTNISTLIPLIENQENGILLSEIKKIKTYLIMMIDEEKISFKNLL